MLAVLSGRDPAPESMTVLVQREVAERIVAEPGTSDWGPLSIRLQLDYDARVVRSVPAGLFWPRPQVESALVHLARRERPREPLDPVARREFNTLVGWLFQRRRQALARVLSEHFDRGSVQGALESLGLDPRRRAEELGTEVLWTLSKALNDPLRGSGAD